MSAPPLDSRDLMEAAALQLRAARARIAELERPRAEPIAVLGAGVRLPGGVEDLAAFWRLLTAGRDAVSPEVVRADGRPVSTAAGRWSGQLSDVDQFDAGFFGIESLEAAHMDPQQRLVLEVAWEALEDAGVPFERLPASTGVFIGAYATDYLTLQLTDPATIGAYTGPGGALSIAANRLSYVLDVHGPSLSIDTACSSSLVAVHLACRALRQGDCDAALVGGVNVIVSPDSSRVVEQVLPVSPTGRCRTFDAAADGIVRAEGCAMLLLQRVSDVRAPGHRIRGLIRGTAVNQDGRSNGLTAPNPGAQCALHRRALADARAEPGDVVYIEAHGTGTRLGDPIELESLADVYGQGAAACAIGSVKTNLGHLEAAAGVVGLIKAMLVLEHGSAPPHLHLERLNPEIELEGTRFVVPTASTPLSPDGRTRLACVSSFGFGGTNAHAVLEGAPPPDPAVEAPAADGLLLALSARNEAALGELIGRYGECLASGDTAAASDICAAAALQRSHHDHRAAFTAPDRDGLVARLRAASAGARARPRSKPRVGFVFGGQGSQWTAMGRELLAREQVVRDEVAACDAVVQALVGWSIADQLAALDGASRVHETEVTQVAVGALQLGLAALWRSWGVEPDAAVGHSMGEIVAGCACGALERAEALELLLRRGRIAERAARGGAMAAVELPVADVERLVEETGGPIAIAAVNGPRSTVVSGEAEAVARLLHTAAAGAARTRRLPVHYGFHSPLLDGCDAELAAAVADLHGRDGEIPLYSTVTGGRIDTRLVDGAHWGRNLRETVLLRPAVEAMAADGVSIFVEIDPHPVLLGDLQETLESSGAGRLAVGSIRRDRAVAATLRDSLVDLYRAGVDIRWDAVLAPPRRPVSLPAYPWQRRRHWFAGEPAPAPRSEPAAGRGIDHARYVRERISAAAGLAIDDVPPDLPLETLGLSSLSIVELRNQVERELGIVVPLAALLGGGTAVDLADAVREALEEAGRLDWPVLEATAGAGRR